MTALTCRQFVELVTAFLDGALDEDTDVRFRRHLRGCAGCDAYFDQFCRVMRALRTVDGPPS